MLGSKRRLETEYRSARSIKMKKKLYFLLILSMFICATFVSAGFFDWLTSITGRAISDGLVAYYKFDEKNGNFMDSSGNDLNTITMTGAVWDSDNAPVRQ